MVKKTGFSDSDSGENPECQNQKKPLRNQLFKTPISSWSLTKHGWLQKNSARVENILRPMVREVVESVFQQHHLSISRSLRNEAEPSNSNPRKFTLKFLGHLPQEIYTWTNIAAVGPSPLEIVLVHAASGEVITGGPLSSAKVKIVVLEGGFKVEDWTQEEFSGNIVRERADKGPLLVGEFVVTLHNGSAVVKEVRFSDNSSWVKTKMFRLGAKIMAQEDQVREAVTPPFKVLHRRGEAYHKDNAPTLQHEVWHLKGILKDKKIHKRLNDNNIFKVEDLVLEYQKDPSSLSKMLNSPKSWKILTKQMTKFLPSNNHYTNQSNSAFPCNAAFSVATAAAANTGIHYSSPTLEELTRNWSLGSNFAAESPMDSLGGIPISDLFTAVDQSGLGTFSNSTFLGAAPMGESMLNLHGASTSQTAKPKTSFWSKIRAAWKTRKLCPLIRGSNKGKFPCISFY